MTGRIVVEADGVGKCYPAFASNMARFARWFGAPIAPTREFWALQDFSLRLSDGEALAVIGANGAGKSTLLKLMTGAVRPTTGRLQLSGSVGAILELGVGFSGELTGRQNIYQAAGFRGLSRRQVDELMPQIQDFAELGDFFDEPLRIYSSGMQARLAFSLVTAVRPDVLIVDEVLSVGDAYFQHKSFDLIRRFKDAGTAIVFVSHGMGDVRALCDRVVLLEKGRVTRAGPPDEVIDLYNAKIAEQEATSFSIEQRRQRNGWTRTRSGSLDATVTEIELLDAEAGKLVEVARVGQNLLLRLRATVHRAVPNLVLGCIIRDRTGHVVWGSNTWHTQQSLPVVGAGEDVEFQLRFPCNLGPGSYALSHALCVGHHHAFGNFEWIDNNLVFEVVNAGHPFFIGSNHLPAAFDVKRSSPWTQTAA